MQTVKETLFFVLGALGLFIVHTEGLCATDDVSLKVRSLKVKYVTSFLSCVAKIPIKPKTAIKMFAKNISIC